MSITTRSLLGMIAAAIMLLVMRRIESGERYTFGQPGAVDVAVEALAWGLAATHAAITAIMWVQRRYWLPSDAAMFRFEAGATLLWATVGANYVAAGRGIRLDEAVLGILIAVLVLDLDIRLIRRYVAETADEREHPWDGRVERRIGPPDRRDGLGA